MILGASQLGSFICRESRGTTLVDEVHLLLDDLYH